MNQTADEPLRETLAKCCILDAVHETMQDFHAIGLADKRTMRQFDTLCIETKSCRND